MEKDRKIIDLVPDGQMRIDDEIKISPLDEVWCQLLLAAWSEGERRQRIPALTPAEKAEAEEIGDLCSAAVCRVLQS